MTPLPPFRTGATVHGMRPRQTPARVALCFAWRQKKMATPGFVPQPSLFPDAKTLGNRRSRAAVPRSTKCRSRPEQLDPGSLIPRTLFQPLILQPIFEDRRGLFSP